MMIIAPTYQMDLMGESAEDILVKVFQKLQNSLLSFLSMISLGEGLKYVILNWLLLFFMHRHLLLRKGL